MKRWLLLLFSLLSVWTALVGCAGDTEKIGLRDTLTHDLSAVRQSQQDALAFWDRIIFGEVVSCQETIAVPETITLSPNDAHAAQIVNRLNAAVQDIQNSADLWNIECASERPYVPLEMAHEGRADALAADQPLSDAAALLAEW